MPAKWQQWMPFHIDRFKASPSVQAMHPAARAGYLYLLSCAWQSDDCTLPSDDFSLAEMSGLGDDLWATFGSRIRRKFSEGLDGRLMNPVLLEEWHEAKRIFEARQASAQRTNTERSKDGHRAVTEQSPSRSADTITGTETITETNTKTKATPKASPSSFTLPLWIHLETWKAFEEMRRKIRAPLTDRARQNIIADLRRLQLSGHDPDEVLNQSITRGWRGVFEIGGNGTHAKQNGNGKQDYLIAMLAEEDDPQGGSGDGDAARSHASQRTH